LSHGVKEEDTIYKLYNDRRSSNDRIIVIEDNNASLFEIQNELVESGYRYSGLQLIVKFRNSEEEIHLPTVVMLACIVELFFNKSKRIIIIIHKGSKAHQFLTCCRFHELWDQRSNNRPFLESLLPTTLNIWKVRPAGIEEFSARCEKFFAQFGDGTRDMSPVSIVIKELCNNIFDHAKASDVAYLLCQHYPRRNFVEICICDFGLSIPVSLRSALKRNDNQDYSNIPDEELIQKATERNVSARSKPGNRGFGLNTLTSIVRAQFGKLSILSGYGVFFLNAIFERNMRRSHRFAGTLVFVRLSLDKFPDIDDPMTEYVDLF
jgi:hypothetical protein